MHSDLATKMTIYAAKYLVVVPLLMVLSEFVRANPKERRTLVQRGIVASAIAIALAYIGGALYQEPRPFVAGHFTPLVPHAADNGFPSDHALLAFTCAFLLFAQLAPLEMVVAGVCATLIAVARVQSGLHSPIDIGASILFAAIAVGTSALIFRSPWTPKRPT